MKRTIFKNACVVSMDPAIGSLPQADVLIEDDRIAAVAQNLDVEDATVIDASKCIVMPGFVDSHRHIWQGAMRGVCANWSLLNYIGAIRMNAASAYTPDDMYAGNYHGALEALDAGVTTVADYCHNIHTPDHAHEAIRGISDAGLRTKWCYGFNRPPLEVPGFSSLDDRVKFLRSLAKKYFSSADSLLTLGVSPEEVFLWASEDSAKFQFETAKDLSARIFWHCNGGKGDSPSRNVSTLNDLGLLDSEMCLVHMHFTDKDEWQMVADSGAAVSFTPDTELQMGMSWPNTVQALKYGVTQSYGADITSNNSGDMFFPLRAALQIGRCQLNEKHDGGFFDGVPISCEQALAGGTIDGAKAVGLDHLVGSLTPGKQADIVMINTDSLTLTGWDRNNAAGTILMQSSVKDIDTVMVAGKVVKKDGKLLADTKRACGLIQAATDRVATIVNDNQGGFYVSPEETSQRVLGTQKAADAT